MRSSKTFVIPCVTYFWIPSLVLDGMIFSSLSEIRSSPAVAYFFPLEFDTWKHIFKHDLLRCFSVHRYSDLHPLILYFGGLPWNLIFDHSPHSISMSHSFLSSVCSVYWSLPVTVHFNMFPLCIIIEVLHRCLLSHLPIHSQADLSSVIFFFFVRLFGSTLQFVLNIHKSNIPYFLSIHLSPVLCLLSCRCTPVKSSFLLGLRLCHFSHLFHSVVTFFRTPFLLTCSFV